MASIVQHSIDWLLTQLKALERGVNEQRVGISQDNARIMELDRRARSLSDPKRRAAALEQIRRLVAQQVRIVRAYRIFGAKFLEISSRARAWLAQHPPASGLGVPIVVPIAIAAAVLVLVAALAWIAGSRRAVGKGITSLDQVLRRHAAGELTDQQLADAMRVIEQQINNERPTGDPFGLAGFAEALVPVGIIVLAIVLVPRLLPRRAAA